jgi:hypothetical protein
MAQPGRIPADEHRGIVLRKNGGKVTCSRLLFKEALRIARRLERSFPD